MDCDPSSRRRRRHWRLFAVAALAGASAIAAAAPEWVPSHQNPQHPPRTIAQAMRQIAPRAEARLRGRFAAHRIAYPPERIDILAFKHSRRVEVRAWSHGRAGVAASYRLLDSSGGPGPKLHEGDEQIPEGVYAVTLLNPNSDYDVSLKLDYPNRFDRSHARRDGRRNLGGQIFIHGDDVSIGCLAVGNAAAEELFVLVDRVGLDNVRVIIAPWDFRQVPPPRVAPPGQPRWLPELYARIDRVLREGSG